MLCGHDLDLDLSGSRDAIGHVTIRPKVKVIHFVTNRFLIYDFLTVDSNFCSRMHRLATVYSILTDRRNTCGIMRDRYGRLKTKEL